MLQGKPAQGIDYQQVAKGTVDFSGADLKAVVDRAIEPTKLQEAIRSGRPTPLTTKDLLQACKLLRPQLANGLPQPKTMPCMPIKAGSTMMSCSISKSNESR